MAARAPIDPRLKISGVRLAVADLARSVSFYERVLGLALVSRELGVAILGPSEQRPALVLEELTEPTVASPHDTGLFHVAWLHPTRSELAATVRRVHESDWPLGGASDHGVSEALYLSDPDGLGIEIYADRPRERWERAADGHSVNMFTEPLDLEDLLAQSPPQATPSIAPETIIGHVHLKVGDVGRAAAFYHDVLGFSERAKMPSAAFLAADGYHHHIGLNSWQSRGASASPPSAPGLRRVDFKLHDTRALTELERRIADAGGDELGLTVAPDQLTLADPDGNRLAFGAEAVLAGS